MRRKIMVVATLSAVIVAMSVTSAIAERLCAAYRPNGSYPPLVHSEPVMQWPGVKPKDGLPLQLDESGRLYWNIDNVATYGLQAWAQWQAQRVPHALVVARHAADWLVTHQPRDGGWRYTVAFSLAAIGLDANLAPGWVAAQAQGDSISLLTRVYRATGDHHYLSAAKRAVAPFDRGVRRHGVRVVFRERVFFDGFPTTPPSLILEDFNIALLGLADVGPYDRHAQELFREGLRSLYWALPYLDDGSGRPLYGLTYLTHPGAPRIYDPAAHTLNAQILCELSRLSPNSQASRYARRWMASNPHAYYR
jgi:hypothetical protein